MEKKGMGRTNWIIIIIVIIIIIIGVYMILSMNTLGPGTSLPPPPSLPE